MGAHLKDIPIHYISFNPNNDLEQSFKNNGMTNIQHFKAVNGKKMDLKLLYNSGELSTHSLYTIQNSRCSGIDMHSKGAIGCYLSHYELWKYAIEQNIPYIMIAEDDFRMKNVKPEYIESIQNQIYKFHNQTPKSVYLMDYHSSNLRYTSLDSSHFNIIDRFYGTGCYIISLEACRELVRKALPMSTQVDSYMSIMQQNKYVQIYGLKDRWSYFIWDTLNSSIQDVCVKCILPHHYGYYAVALVIIAAVSYKAYTCKTCKS